MNDSVKDDNERFRHAACLARYGAHDLHHAFHKYYDGCDGKCNGTPLHCLHCHLPWSEAKFQGYTFHRIYWKRFPLRSWWYGEERGRWVAYFKYQCTRDEK